MLKINPQPTFTADVKVPVPGSDNPASMTLTFKHMGRAAVKAWVSNSAGLADPEMLSKVIEGWRGVEADDGAPVSYSQAALANVLDAYSGAGSAIFDAYLAELSGNREKNS
jgi:hypothetical protein